ncbi:hypothetical protein FIBSPDRAFT_855391 [Athelia psychrophila]|uniref:Uncharacterized protein n=1 Tax=Athelia psychrophila TaxID=1759441 RepID=A0A166PH81_9AGAM|nr:hypothetical protein FIBSPDRAFT_855391 [Fibularhizoctonia sp. CBS 109695]
MYMCHLPPSASAPRLRTVRLANSRVFWVFSESTVPFHRPTPNPGHNTGVPLPSGCLRESRRIHHIVPVCKPPVRKSHIYTLSAQRPTSAPKPFFRTAGRNGG